MDLNWFEEMEARIPKDGVRTRFAPSPTGYMHVGNLRTPGSSPATAAASSSSVLRIPTRAAWWRAPPRSSTPPCASAA